MKTIEEFVKKWAMETPEKVAVIVDGSETTYSHLYDLAKQYAGYLSSAGVSDGKIVITRASQNLEYVVIYLAIHLAGGVVCSLENNVSKSIIYEIADKMQADYILEDACDASSFKCIAKNDVLKMTGYDRRNENC